MESSYALKIQAAKYNHVNINAMMAKQFHLTAVQRSFLHTILSKYQTLIDGKLQVHLE